MSDFKNKEKIANEMAAVIVEKVKSNGECTRSDLLQAGFTEETIDRCNALAQSFAAVELDKKSNLH